MGVDTCAMMLDQGSLINAASRTLVYRLGLSTTPHPESYQLLWMDKYIAITMQVEVKFSLDGYVVVITCGVIPIHMRVLWYMASLGCLSRRFCGFLLPPLSVLFHVEELSGDCILFRTTIL